MNTLAAIALLMFPSSTAQPSAEAAVARAVTAWVEMWNSYDLNEVDRLFVVGPEVSYFSSEKSGLIQGIDAVREHHRELGFIPGGKKTDSTLWIDDVRTTILGDTAVVTATWYFRRSADESAAAQKGPMTAVYVRRGTEWRIVHMHFSGDSR